MQVYELLSFLTRLFPRFEECWDAEKNIHRSRDNVTPHGVCAQFSAFYQQHLMLFEKRDIASLFGMVEIILADDATDKKLMANAISTCFLENISQTQAGEVSIRYMGPTTRSFFDVWHCGGQAGL